MHSHPKKSIRLEDIARKLNISKVAVSKALRNHPDISRETKRLVQETAEALGYVPNFIARNLSAQRSNTIGLVVPKIAHHFFAEAIESIYETAHKHHYEIIMTVSQENARHETEHIQTLLSMRVDGLLVSITEQTRQTQIFETVRERGVPLVFFDRVIEGINFSCVTSDDLKSTFEGISKVLERGYTEIGHLAGSQSTNIGRNRLTGFKKAFDEKNIEIRSDWIVEGGFSEQDGYRGFHRLYKRGPLPRILFTVTYPVALGVLLAADELKLNIPEELEIISFGGSNYNRFIKPSLSYIDQPVRDIADTATELLIREITSGGTDQPVTIDLPSKLVLCETCIKGKNNHESIP
jgi:LacI family transcriptional regulator